MSAPLAAGTLIDGIALRDVSIRSEYAGERFAAGAVNVYAAGWQPVVVRLDWSAGHARVLSARVAGDDVYPNWIAAAEVVRRIAAACNAVVVEPPAR